MINIFDYNKFLLEFVETRSNTPVLYKDKNLEVKVVKTPDSAKNQGKNTNWCSNNKSGFYKHNRTANMYRFNFKDGYKLRLTWDYINRQASEDQYSGGTHWGQGGILNGKELPYTYIRPKDEDNPFDFDYKKNDRKLMVDRILSIPDEAKMSVYEYQEKNTREKNAIFNNLYKEIQKVKIIDVSEWISGIISKIRYNDEIFYIKISLFKDFYFIPSDIDRIIKFKSTYNRGELSIYIYDKTIEYIKNNKPEIINHIEKFK